jgi:hypothetical protein
VDKERTTHTIKPPFPINISLLLFDHVLSHGKILYLQVQKEAQAPEGAEGVNTLVADLSSLPSHEHPCTPYIQHHTGPAAADHEEEDILVHIPLAAVAVAGNLQGVDDDSTHNLLHRDMQADSLAVEGMGRRVAAVPGRTDRAEEGNRNNVSAADNLVG